MTRPLRLVVDTNVLVSAFLSSKGAPARLISALELRKFILLTSSEITSELMRVLQYPKIVRRLQDPEETLRAAARLLLDSSEHVRDFSLEPMSPDPDDDVFIAVARAAQADALITGDKSDLLSLKLDTPLIITAAAALEKFNF